MCYLEINHPLLQKDIEIYHQEYSDVVSKLKKSKAKLLDLRNNLYELELLNKEMGKVIMVMIIILIKIMNQYYIIFMRHQKLD